MILCTSLLWYDLVGLPTVVWPCGPLSMVWPCGPPFHAMTLWTSLLCYDLVDLPSMLWPCGPPFYAMTLWSSLLCYDLVELPSMLWPCGPPFCGTCIWCSSKVYLIALHDSPHIYINWQSLQSLASSQIKKKKNCCWLSNSGKKEYLYIPTSLYCQEGRISVYKPHYNVTVSGSKELHKAASVCCQESMGKECFHITAVWVRFMQLSVRDEIVWCVCHNQVCERL